MCASDRRIGALRALAAHHMNQIYDSCKVLAHCKIGIVIIMHRVPDVQDELHRMHYLAQLDSRVALQCVTAPF